MQVIVPSPMSAQTGMTQDGKESEHTLSNTGARRFLVIEQDGGNADEQAAILLHLAARAPLVLAVHSGSKSIHGWFMAAGQPEERLRRFMRDAVALAVCIHAGVHGAHAHEHALDSRTAEAAIELADWFAAQQLEILSAGRYTARRKIRDDVLTLLAGCPAGIRASDVYRARIVRDAKAAHDLLATMEAEGLLAGRDVKPEGGGHVSRIYTTARK
jgi:hypothetical protein